MNKKNKKYILLIALLSFSACSPTATRKPLHQQILFTQSEEAQVQAQQGVDELLKKCALQQLTATEDSRYQKLFNRILASLEAPLSGVKMQVLDCKDVNAVSFIAVRRIFLYKGILDLNPTDDELAFVLAHEVAHHYKPPAHFLQAAATTSTLVGESNQQLIENCERQKYKLSKNEQKELIENCKKTLQLWSAMDQGNASKLREEFTDQLALDLLMAAGFQGEASETMLAKMATKEEMIPTIQQDGKVTRINIAQYYGELVSSHPPAHERLRYLSWWRSLGN